MNAPSDIELYIDADGCPVKDETYKVASRYQLRVWVVANRNMNVPLHPSVTMKTVSEGPDEADNWIAEHITPRDICITGDIPLADRCLKKGAKALDHRGNEFTEDMIGDAMATRELMKELREMGEVRGGPSAFEKKDRSQFLSTLDRLIQKLKRA